MITVACCIVGWLLGWVLLGSPQRVGAGIADRGPDGGQGADPGPVPPDIVIPARDEARVIGGLLADLTGAGPTGQGPASQDRARPIGRIVVVDDHSADGTGTVAAAFPGVEVVAAADLPDGWAGKPWACHTGVQALFHNPQPHVEVEGSDARDPAPPLVFLDADVRLPDGSEALLPLLRAQRAHGGLVSVQPWHDTERPYEQLSALFNVLAVMGAATGSRRGSRAAFGPVLVTDRAGYELAGGHRAVRGAAVEDLALADNYRRAGLTVDVGEGGPGIRFRMYPGGVGQLVEGWSKSFATGAGATRPLRLLGTVLWIAGLGSAVVGLVAAARGELPWWLALGLYAAMVAQLAVAFRRVGRFAAWSAWCYPVLLVVFLVVFARSLWQTYVRRRVTWRGRQIPLGPGRDGPC